MITAATFSLLNLPWLARNEILNCMRSQELLMLSMASKKMATLVKGNTRKHRFHMEVHGNCCSCVYLDIKTKSRNYQENLNFLKVAIKNKHRKLSSKEPIMSEKLEGVTVPLTDSGKTITTFWKNQTKGYQKIISLLCKVFDVKLISLHFSKDCEKRVASILEYIEKLKVAMKVRIIEINITDPFMNPHFLKFILDHYSDVPKLSIISKACAKFWYNHVRPYPKEHFRVDYAHWITLNHLHLLLKCKSIALWNLRLTSQEVNLFLKKWMEGSILDTIDLLVLRVDVLLAVEGMPVTPENKVLVHGEIEQETTACYGLQRSSDGVKATIWSWDGCFLMRTDNLL